MGIYTFSEKAIGALSRFVKGAKKKERYSRIKLRANLELLNQDQRKAVDVVQKALKEKEPTYMLIHGVAGTGKSFVLGTIRAILQNTFGDGSVLVVAPTGIASTYVDGQTIHSALKIPLDYIQNPDIEDDQMWIEGEIERCKLGGITHERELQDLTIMMDTEIEFKEMLSKVKFIIIDECSMLSLQLFGYIEGKLRANLKSDSPFAGISVILLGDFGQLPPVGGTALYQTPIPGDKLAVNGALAYKMFNKVVFLDEVVRQMGDEQAKFRDLLLNVRNGTVTQSDVDLLNTRASCNLSPQERNEFENGVYLFSTNAEVNKHNNCELKKLNTPQVQINATVPMDEDELSHLCMPICDKLAIGAKVMLLQNLWTEAGLVNGACGMVQSIVYLEGTSEPDMPAIVNVKFDNYRGVCPAGQDSVPIKPIVLINEALKKKKWKQLPLRLCYGSTIHKSQSRTIPKLVIDFRKTFKLWHCLAFVALSRAPTLSALVLVVPLCLKQFATNKDLSLKEILQEEKRLRAIAL